jgi:hypothetical protein
MPVAHYTDVMNELMANGNGAPAQRLVHLCSPIAEGFRITEVWESHEAADKFGDEAIRPAIIKVVGEQAVAGGPPPNQEFELIGLQLRDDRVLP